VRITVEIHRRDISLLGCARRRRNLLGQLKDRQAALVLLLPQTQVRSFDVTIRDSRHANDRLLVWKATEKKMPFALDPGVSMVPFSYSCRFMRLVTGSGQIDAIGRLEF